MTGGRSEHHVAAEGAVADGERVVVDVEGTEIAVFNVDGSYHALLNHCVHQGGPVCEGALTGRLTVDGDDELVYDRSETYVACPWHGWKFDVETGRDLARPAEYALPTFEVRVRDGEIYVVF